MTFSTTTFNPIYILLANFIIHNHLPNILQIPSPNNFRYSPFLKTTFQQVWIYFFCWDLIT